MRCDTVGYGFTPAVQRRRLLGGQIPSRSAQGAEVLVYHLFRNDRTRGTVITVACPQDLAHEAIARFRALTEPGYTPPAPPGVCVLDGDAGRVWIGGVLASTVPGLRASYDLPLDDKALQNRDRTVIEAGALRDAVRVILAGCEDQQVIDRFASHVLAGGSLREPEQFFTQVNHPRVRAAWRTWARTHLPARTFYTTSGNEEAALALHDLGYTEVAARGLSSYHQSTVMDLLGVEVARARQQRHHDKTRNKTTWVPERALTPAQRAALGEARSLVCRAVGAFALDRVRVYSDSEEMSCTLGFYNPRNGDVAVHRDALGDRHVLLGTLLHEAAHRVAHRGGGRFMPVPDYGDRCRGFENLLTEFAALLLGYLAGGDRLPDPADPPDRAPAAGRRRRSGAEDPAVPVSRRELAHLLTDRLPAALAEGGFTDVKDLIAATAVHPDYWRTLTNPRPAGFRRVWGGRAWDYDKVALLAEAVGVHHRPPAVDARLSGDPWRRHGRAGRRHDTAAAHRAAARCDAAHVDPVDAPDRYHQPWPAAHLRCLGSQRPNHPLDGPSPPGPERRPRRRRRRRLIHLKDCHHTDAGKRPVPKDSIPMTCHSHHLHPCLRATQPARLIPAPRGIPASTADTVRR